MGRSDYRLTANRTRTPQGDGSGGFLISLLWPEVIARGYMPGRKVPDADRGRSRERSSVVAEVAMWGA